MRSSQKLSSYKKHLTLNAFKKVEKGLDIVRSQSENRYYFFHLSGHILGS